MLCCRLLLTRLWLIEIIVELMLLLLLLLLRPGLLLRCGGPTHGVLPGAPLPVHLTRAGLRRLGLPAPSLPLLTAAAARQRRRIRQGRQQRRADGRQGLQVLRHGSDRPRGARTPDGAAPGRRLGGGRGASARVGSRSEAGRHAYDEDCVGGELPNQLLFQARA